MKIIFQEEENGQLCVQVNPVTGRIYGFFYDYPVFESQVSDPNVMIVRVNTTIEEFAQELSNGLFYKSGLFIRPVKFDQISYSYIIGQPFSASVELPEQPQEPEFCQIQLKSEDGTIHDSISLFLTDKTTQFTLFPTNFSSIKSLKLFASTNNYGTCSAQVFAMTQEEIDTVKIQIKSFEQTIPAEQIMNQEALEKVLQQVSGVDFNELTKIIEESNVEDKESLLKLARAQLRIPNMAKQSIFDKLLKFVKGESNE